MNYYALFYHVCGNYIERRVPYRNEHLGLAKEAHERGELILGGAFNNPPNGALLIFKGEDRSVAENFVKNDPYVKEGLIEKWEIRDWTVVIGNE